MEIELRNIKVRDLVDGYKDNSEEGVIGYHGRLDIRPAYQREFIYKDKQRDMVIDTVTKDLPLNVMYWAVTGENEEGETLYEVMDGQQRTISLCSYINGDFAIDYRFFHNLTQEEKDQILDYELMIYICEGTDREKLDWFNIINIAGEKLTKQELRNAVYTGQWLTDAKRHFSKRNCPAHGLASNYLSGNSLRQDYLQAALSWISHREEKTIEEYMAEHQHDEDASELWQYFQEVISWVERIFPNYRKQMKGLDWGVMYNKYGNNPYNSKKLEEEIERLLLDDDVTQKKGIYEYLLSGDEKHLNIRAFTQAQKLKAYEKQNKLCAICKEEFELKEMEADHIDPWSEGGKTTQENCQMLCKPCNRRKSNK